MRLEDVEALEKQVNALRALYDNYFAGLEKREPRKKRDELTQQLRNVTIDGGGRSTQLAFRVNNLRARLATFEAHWDRITRQIEEGTYKRDQQRAAKILGKPEAKKMEAVAPASATAAANAAAASAAVANTPPPNTAPPTAAPANSQDTYRQLYESYASGRAKTKEPPVSFQAMVATIEKQTPVIKDRFKCKAVEFRVVEKDGKTILKAFPTN